MHHSGTGRFSWLTMRPMTLFESGESSGKVSLRHLFDNGGPIAETCKLDISDIAYLICRGGWPFACGLEKKAALAQAYDYVDAVVKKDISRVDGVKRSATTAKLLMRSYARHQGAQATIGTIVADLSANGDKTVSEKTISSYIEALRKIFVIEDSEAWNPNLRSKSAIRTQAQDILSTRQSAQLLLDSDLTTCCKTLIQWGCFSRRYAWETCVYMLKRSTAKCFISATRQDLNAMPWYICARQVWIDRSKTRCDKLIEEGAENLKTLSSRIDTDKMKTPSFLMILTAAGDFAYQRKDGVYVVPIGCLKD